MLDVTTIFPKPSWTDERIATLKRLHADGHYASAIARIMGPGLSRCAVLGKLNRLGLSNKQSAPKPQSRRQRRRNRNRVIEESFGGSIGKSQSFAAANIARRARAEASQIESDALTDLPPDQSPDAVSLFNVTDNQCRWPLSDPGPGFLFCGSPIKDGKPLKECAWCVRHARMAFAPGKPIARSTYVDRRNGVSS